MRVEKLNAPLGRGASNTWSAAGTPNIISDAQAAARLFMSVRQFKTFAERHQLSAMQDGTGATYRSIAQIETLAKELGLRIQFELPWRVTA